MSFSSGSYTPFKAISNSLVQTTSEPWPSIHLMLSGLISSNEKKLNNKLLLQINQNSKLMNL